MRWIMLTGALVACATGGEHAPPAAEEWNHAVAMADCAPWDGPATTVYLTQVPYSDSLPPPSLRLAVYHGVDEVAGARWDVGLDNDQDGVPTLCPEAGACVPAQRGWVEFEAREAGGPLVGRYDLMFDDGRRRTGRFTAPVLERLALCG